jgi:DNA-binding MarR family transcriptional regulator
MTLNTNFDWKTYGWLKRGNRRIEVLRHLSQSEGPLTATEIKKEQSIDITQSAFTLNELWKTKLVECFNPDDHHGKLFVISKKGREMLKQLDKKRS